MQQTPQKYTRNVPATYQEWMRSVLSFDELWILSMNGNADATEELLRRQEWHNETHTP
jgi:hypothetical protein